MQDLITESWEKELRKELFSRVIFDEQAIEWMINWVKARDKKIKSACEKKDAEHV
jgi:hypothetical protein